MSAFWQLNNVATTAGYTDANTMYCPGAQVIDLDVSGAAIFYRIGHGHPPALVYDAELLLPPTFRSRPIHADGVQIRSVVATAPAQVTLSGRP